MKTEILTGSGLLLSFGFTSSGSSGVFDRLVVVAVDNDAEFDVVAVVVAVVCRKSLLLEFKINLFRPRSFKAPNVIL